jgi:hypothetical protein
LELNKLYSTHTGWLDHYILGKIKRVIVDIFGLVIRHSQETLNCQLSMKENISFLRAFYYPHDLTVSTLCISAKVFILGHRVNTTVQEAVHIHSLLKMYDYIVSVFLIIVGILCANFLQCVFGLLIVDCLPVSR